MRLIKVTKPPYTKCLNKIELPFPMMPEIRQRTHAGAC